MDSNASHQTRLSGRSQSLLMDPVRAFPPRNNCVSVAGSCHVVGKDPAPENTHFRVESPCTHKGSPLSHPFSTIMPTAQQLSSLALPKCAGKYPSHNGSHLKGHFH